MIRTLFYILTILIASSLAFAQQAQDANLLDNPTFTGPAGEVPTGWSHRTKSSGFVKTMTEGDDSFVRIGAEPNDEGEDSFIQQTVALPENTANVTITLRYRWQDITKGDKSYYGGKVQGRFTKGGKETGKWIDIAGLTGSGDWTEKTRVASLPKEGDVDGVMLRVGGYGLKSGHLDVASASIVAVSREQAAANLAERMKEFRSMAPYGDKPSDERFARLAKGININNWFGQPYNAKDVATRGGFNAEHFRSYITEQDLKQLKSAGITNVRLPVEVAAFMDLKTGDIDPALLPELDRAIKMMVDAGLAVQVDFHPKEKRVDSFNTRPEQAEHFIKWIGQMSKHLADTTDPEWVFIELLNEPGGLGLYTQRWQIYQDRLINEARKNAPEHTLIVNAGGYMLWSDTLRFEPHPDRNVIVAVHYYEPSQFTHQGAVWMKDWYSPLRYVTWPFREQDLAGAIERLDRAGKNGEFAPKSEQVLKSMLSERLGLPEKMAENFDKVAEWAKQHDVRVIVNEFGVYKKFVNQEDRLRYLRDIVQAMESRGFGWTMWEFAHDFGLASGRPGSRVYEADTLEALGLKAP